MLREDRGDIMKGLGRKEGEGLVLGPKSIKFEILSVVNVGVQDGIQACRHQVLLR